VNNLSGVRDCISLLKLQLCMEKETLGKKLQSGKSLFILTLTQLFNGRNLLYFTYGLFKTLPQ
jgi:hypothetical protein